MEENVWIQYIVGPRDGSYWDRNTDIVILGNFQCQGSYFNKTWHPFLTASCEHVILHQIFGNPTSSFGGQAPKQTVWVSNVIKCIPTGNDFKRHQAVVSGPVPNGRNMVDSGAEIGKRVSFDPFDLPSDVRTLARIVYSAHGGEIAATFLRGRAHIFSGMRRIVVPA